MNTTNAQPDSKKRKKQPKYGKTSGILGAGVQPNVPFLSRDGKEYYYDERGCLRRNF